MPIRAPVNPRAPAVVATMIRRVVPLAPVAVSVRRSRAASLRTRPTLMPRMASASTMPKTVASLTTVASDGMLLRVSTDIPDAAATCWAFLIWAAVRTPRAWMNQPAALTGDCRFSARRPCSVTTVFGADGPEGSWLICWIGGLAMQLPAGHGHWFWPGAPSPFLGLLTYCINDKPARPERTVRKSASGLTWDWLMPNRLSSWGVAR